VPALAILKACEIMALVELLETVAIGDVVRLPFVHLDE
jgi:hypothetical protein